MSDMEVALSQFKRISISDWELIESYLQGSQYQESNHNIVNLMMWKHKYPIWMYEGINWLLLLGIHEGQWFLYMPLCKQGGCYKEALRFGESIFKEQNVPYILSCYTEEVKDAFLEFDSEFDIIEIRDGFDYIYSYEQLATFKGKKMQKKRNHINAFLKEYEGRWTYESMTDSSIAEVVQFLKQWHEKEDQDSFLDDEISGVKFILSYWGILPAKGGIIRIDGVIKGFSIGSKLNDDTIQTNIEKADGSIRGLYPLLTREFTSREFAPVQWVNREDDMGHENIRQAKLSLQPEYLVKKFRLQRKTIR